MIEQPESTEYSAKHDITLNSLDNDLGWKAFPEKNGGSTLKDKIDAFIKRFDQRIDFVMITGRMDESLIILKEYLVHDRYPLSKAHDQQLQNPSDDIG